MNTATQTPAQPKTKVTLTDPATLPPTIRKQLRRLKLSPAQCQTVVANFHRKREEEIANRPTRKQKRKQARLQREAMKNHRKLTKPLKWREPVARKTGRKLGEETKPTEVELVGTGEV